MLSSLRKSFGFALVPVSLEDLQAAIRSSDVDTLDTILSNVDGDVTHKELMSHLNSFSLCKLSSLLCDEEEGTRVKTILDNAPFDFSLLLLAMIKHLLTPTIKKPTYKRFFMRIRKAMAVRDSYKQKHFMQVEECDANASLLVKNFGHNIPWEEIASYLLSQHHLAQLDKDRIVSIMRMDGLRESLLNLKKHGVAVELFEMMLTHPENDISSLEVLTSPAILWDYNCINADALICKLLPSIETFNATIQRRLSAYANVVGRPSRDEDDENDENDVGEDEKERMKRDEDAIMQEGIFLYLQYRDFMNWFLDEQRGGLQKYYSKAFRSTVQHYYEAVGADFSLYVYSPPGILDYSDGLVDKLSLTPSVDIARYVEKVFTPPTLFHRVQGPIRFNNIRGAFEVVYRVPDARLLFESSKLDKLLENTKYVTTFTIFYLQTIDGTLTKFKKSDWNNFITFSLRLRRGANKNDVALSLVVNFHGQVIDQEVPLCTVNISDILSDNTSWEHLVVSYDNSMLNLNKKSDWSIRVRYRRLPSSPQSKMEDSGYVTATVRPNKSLSATNTITRCTRILKEARRYSQYTLCMSHPSYRYRVEVLQHRAFDCALSDLQMEQLFAYTHMTTKRLTSAQPEVIYYDKSLVHLKPRLQAPVKATDVAGLVPKNALSQELLQEQKLTLSKSSLQTVCFNCAGFGEFPLYMEKAGSDSSNTKTVTTQEPTDSNVSSSSLSEQEKGDDRDDHDDDKMGRDRLLSEDSEVGGDNRIEAPKEERVLTLKLPQQLEQEVYDPERTAATMELQIPGQHIKWYHSHHWQRMKSNEGITTNDDTIRDTAVDIMEGNDKRDEIAEIDSDFLTYYDNELDEDSKIKIGGGEGSWLEFDDAMCRLLEEARVNDFQNHVVNVSFPSPIIQEEEERHSSGRNTTGNNTSPREMLRGGIEGAMCIDIDTFHMTMVQKEVQSGELFYRRLIRINKRDNNDDKERGEIDGAVCPHEESSSLKLISVSPGNSGKVRNVEQENHLVIDVPSPANSFRGSLKYTPSPRDNTNTNTKSDSDRNSSKSNKSNGGLESAFNVSFGNVMTSLFVDQATNTSLPATKLSNYTKGVTCWVCSGSGTTAKWFCREVKEKAEYIDALPKPVDPFAVEGEEEEGAVECPICCGDAKYGLSIECNHLFCEMCAEHSLRAVLESGQFPALCPMCRAEGTKKTIYNKKTHSHEEVPAGEITRPVLTFLQEREVISKEFQFRFVNAMTRNRLEVGTNDDEFFKCPHKDCQIYLYRCKPVYGRIGDSLVSKLATCPCGQVLCIQCGKAEEEKGFYGKDHHKFASVRTKGTRVHDCDVKEHMTMAKKQKSIEDDAESLALVSKLGKKCPVCSTFIEKNDGCHIMLCGDSAHGKISLALQKGGCGAIFDWNSLKVLEEDNYIDFNEKRKAGVAITARMLKDWPKCANPACGYFKSTDHAKHPLITKGGTQSHNNGGEYCCNGCKCGRGHDQLCHKLKVNDYGDDIIREIQSEATPIKYLVPIDAQLVMLSFLLEDQPVISSKEFQDELQKYFNVNTFSIHNNGDGNNGHESSFQFLGVDDVSLSMHYAIPMTKNCAIEILPLPLAPRENKLDLRFQIPLDIAGRGRYAKFYPTALRNDGNNSHPSIHKGGDNDFTESNNGKGNLKVGGIVYEEAYSNSDQDNTGEVTFLRHNALNENDQVSFCVLIDFGSVKRIKAIRSHLFQKFSVRIGYSADPLPLIGSDGGDISGEPLLFSWPLYDQLAGASFESKLGQYYQLKGHDDKLHNVPAILERFRGREDELLALLHYKYAVLRRKLNEKGSVNDLDKINFHALLKNWILYKTSNSKSNTEVGVKIPFRASLEEEELESARGKADGDLGRAHAKGGANENDQMEIRGGAVDYNDHIIKPSVELEEERRMLKAALGAEATECPACGHIIIKDGGDDNLMCGCEAKAAGGTIEKALAGGGCGHEFNCRTLAPLGTGKMGDPANHRQWRFS